MSLSVLRAALLAAALAAAPPAHATVITDPAGDFLGTYTGPQNGDLDILSVSATFDGTSFRLGSTQNGAIGTTSNSLFVFGINRGAGTARFQFLGAPPAVGAGILWDSLLVLFPDGSARAVTFAPGPPGPPTITPLSGVVTIDGSSISGVVPLSLLPSTGFSSADYGFSMWTRRRIDPAVDSGNFELADFAPNASTFKATAVPEPSTWGLMIVGFGAIGCAMIRQRKVAFA